MASGQQIALQPSLAGMFGEYLHHPSVGREVVVLRQHLGHPGAVGHLEQRAEAVGVGFVRAHHAEVSCLHVQLHYVAQVTAHDPGCLRLFRAWAAYRDGIVAEVRQPQILEQQPAVGMRIGAHAPFALRRQCRQFRQQATVAVEQFLGTVAPHPLLE